MKSYEKIEKESTGADIMVGGIAFQLGQYRPLHSYFVSDLHVLASLVIFAALSTEFFYRVYYDKPIRAVPKTVASPDSSNTGISFSKTSSAYGQTRPLRILLSGMAFSLTCLFTR